ncbi:tetratricopeptide repeat protein [Pseudofulvibacter geojedonensis]|uniref:Tetratricopeptide repeat protein n=1 Tax=Pseudofulvibacter geojedonensis TaxID=1123758 RepID=A0ABW3I4F8_9FLAO
MEKSLKLSLSMCLILLLFSCKKNTKNELSLAERKEKSKQILREGMSLYQGSSESMIKLEEAIKLDRNNYDAWRELSIPYLKRGIPYKWKAIYDTVVAIHPPAWQAWRGYNYLWFYRDYKKAITDFDTADSFNPNFTEQAQGHSVDYWRGIAYLGLKDYNNSIKYFDKYINKEINDSGEDWVEVTAFLYRGIAFYESGDYENALFNFNKLLHYTKGRYADGNYYKALVLEKNKNLKEALVLTNQAIKNYNDGYYNNRPYVETLRQIYIDDLQELKDTLEKKNK